MTTRSGGSGPPGGSGPFVSLLTDRPDEADTDLPDESVLTDLNLDQVIQAIAGDRDQRDLITRLLSSQAPDVATVRYRHQVFQDLETSSLATAAREFSRQMGTVRTHLAQLPKMYSGRQRQGWFLDAAAIYCDAVAALLDAIAAASLRSPALAAARDYLAAYAESAEFTTLVADTAARRSELGRILYQIRIKGPKVEVSRYDGEPDYSAEIEQTFARFQQGAVKDYGVHYRTWPGMTHVAAQIAELVAKLFRTEFNALSEYCQRHARFIDPVISQVDRELQFYLAYLDFIEPLRSAGLSFCYPELSTESKEIFARESYDLALASRLVATRKPVVTNEFHLTGAERVIVVSGPNQGGKTTFARTFGQLHHLALTGCPVPGSQARLFVFDQIFTHFEREEDLANLAGKLETDLVRIQKALLAATPRSIIIMNEIFTSTTLSDARFLGEKVLTKVIELDLLCVYVSFVDELASLGPSVVSMASTIVAANPAERTYKVVRKPADGLAFALAIAEKHGVTYGQLKGRIRP